MRVQNNEVKFEVFKYLETPYNINEQEEVKAKHLEKKGEYMEKKNKKRGN